MTRSLRRIVSTFVVATLVASSTMLFCAPAIAAAAPSQGHCKPSASVQAACSHCQKDVLDCCDTSLPQPASVPEDSRTQGTSSAPTAMLIPAGVAAVAAALNVPDILRVLRAAPLHGYHSTDLLTLNAVFLI